jgi:hypothetical protein
MITVTPISSIGTRDNKNEKGNKQDKCNSKSAINPISFKEFLADLHMEQTEQM